MRSHRYYAALISILVFSSALLTAAPIPGKVYEFRQPDGSLVPVRVWGDEFYQRVESLDGYTVIRDSNGWICYADVTPDEQDFTATEVVYDGKERKEALNVKALSKGQVKNLEKGLKIKSSARLKKHKEARDAFNHSQLIAPNPIVAAAGQAGTGIQPGAPLMTEPLLGSVVGLVICIDFSDEAGTITTQQVDNYCNQQGYNEFGNNGSIRDFYYDISGGNLTYTNVVVGYYRAQNPKTYYDDPARGAGDAGRELLAEALDWLETQNFDFTQLSVDGTDTMLAINVFYAGQVTSGWAMGLWPHSGYYPDFVSASGVRSGRYQITDMGNALSIGTFCHENGHMICHWPDLYDYGYESAGAGGFCLMAYGGDELNPVPANAYYRDIKGWDTVTEMDGTTGPIYSHQANTTSSFRFSNPGKPTEFFYIESRVKTGRNASLPDDGFIIWHVDELGSNDNEQMTPSLHYLVSVEQADAMYHLEQGLNYGDNSDLFSLDYRPSFNDNTQPSARWWDGKLSGLDFTVTSPVGATMTFQTADMTPPTPNPMQWKVAPVAVGLHTIYMEGATASDSAGVQYRFICVTDPAFNSQWQDSPIYYRGGFTSGTAYQFQVVARDKSPYQNETEPTVAAVSGLTHLNKAVADHYV